nr:MAG TPA: hypothetical protein [Caudoviricetes sp.]
MAENWKQQVYSDFSGGYNDISPGIDIQDKEMKLSENADYAAEVKALQTRKGCSKVNSEAYGANVTDGYAWLIGSTYKKCVVKGGKLYDLDISNGALTYKCDLSNGAKQIYPYIMGNTLFFGDGQELWQWGATDFSSESGLKSVGINKVVKCNYTDDLPTEDFKDTDRTQDIKEGTFVKNTTTGKTYKSLKAREKVNLETDDYSNTENWLEIVKGEYGEKGHFYISVTNLGAVNLKHENFKDAAKWRECTDVKNFSSSVVRKVSAYDPAKEEEIVITVTSGATAAATVTVCLDNVTKTFKVTDGEVVSSIVDKLSKVGFDDWNAAVTGNSVMFTAKEKGSKVNGYVDPSTSGIAFSYETKTEGKDNDCDLTAIKKCTIFCVHQGSQRVFAAGNPDDNGLYYSEIGYGNYFKSEINKVYPAINGYGAVTGMINLSNALLVSYESGWCAWTGATVLSDATWRILNLPYGCVSARTLCLTPNSFTYLGKDGVYCVSAALLSDDYVLLESNQIIKKLSENVIENTIQEFKNKRLCEAVFYNNVYMLTYSTNGEYCDRVLKYEWDTSSFTLVTGWRVNRWLNDPENLYFASNNFILKAFDRYTDVYTEEVRNDDGSLLHAPGDDKAIELHVKTKEFFFDSPITNKVVQMVGLIFQQHNNIHSSAEITIRAGYSSYHLKPTDLAESLYYGREWGKIWGYREAIVKMIEIVMVSNTFQIELQNSAIEDPITLIGVGFVYDTTDLVIPTILKDEELLK